MIARKARLESVIEGARKQPREDLITSALFGTIKFLTPSGRSEALRALTGKALHAQLDIFLWPCFKFMDSLAEPDVVLRARAKDGPVFWIVEVKWGAPLGPDQVGREISALAHGICRRGGLSEGPRKIVGYTLLGAEAKHTVVMDKAVKQFRELEVVSLAWPVVAERLRQVERHNTADPGLAAWAEAAGAFLRTTSKGSVLGNWPELCTPASASYGFDAGRNLVPGAAAMPVPSAHFDFAERV